MSTVYLAGPIAGCTYDGCVDWRESAAKSLAEAGIKALSPMRAKEYLKAVAPGGEVLKHPYPVGTRVSFQMRELYRSGVTTYFGEVRGHDRYQYEIESDDKSQSWCIHWAAVRVVTATLSATCEEYGALSPLSSPRGIMTRDRFDATRCDVLLVNLLGATKPSLGSVMEIGWADLCRTPIVAVMEPSGNSHDHAMVNEAIGFRCATLDEALHVVRSILL